jgi:hypothetical protein
MNIEHGILNVELNLGISAFFVQYSIFIIFLNLMTLILIFREVFSFSLFLLNYLSDNLPGKSHHKQGHQKKAQKCLSRYHIFEPAGIIRIEIFSTQSDK